VHRADSLTPSCADCLQILGASTSWNPQGLSRLHYGSGVNLASNRNEYQGYFLGGKGSQCIGLTALHLHVLTVYKFSEPQPPGTLRAYPAPYRDCLFSWPSSTILSSSKYEHFSREERDPLTQSSYHSKLLESGVILFEIFA
jgi:hypothetical protein